jgi:uncharacterized protein YjiS (DUF1127 family)
MSIVELRSLQVRRDSLSAIAARQGRIWARGVLRAVQLLQTWRDRAQQRRQLQCLNDHMLRDIGLTRADVFAEASKPFWRP